MKKILIATTFREANIRSKNYSYQKKFLQSLNSSYERVDLFVNQFGENNIKDFVTKYFKGNVIFRNTKLINYKWSHSILLKNATSHYIKYHNRYEYISWSTSDIIYTKEIFMYLADTKSKELLVTYFPNTMVNYKNTILPFGLDVFFIKTSNNNLKKLIKILRDYPNYDWGIFEQFLFSLSELFKLKIINLRDYGIIYKYENNRKKNYRSTQVSSWRVNKKIFLKFLKNFKLTDLYANGSMYFISFKIFKSTFKFNKFYIKTIFLLSIKLIFRMFKINI